jgi:hypothetical protein
MYVKIVNNQVDTYPYSIRDLRGSNMQVSFPENPNKEVLARWGVFAVRPKNPPSFDYATQECVRVNPTLQGEEWVETWEIKEITEEEKARRTEERAAQVRATRASLLLQNVDSIGHIRWSLLSDEEKETVLAYRQALLEVPEQEEFPWNVVWPEPPSL